MRILRVALCSVAKRKRALSRYVNLSKAKLQAEMAGGTIVVGRKVKLDVPVRVDGKGSVELEDHVCIGTTLAAKLGTGEAVLQARHSDSIIRIGAGTFTNNNIAVYSCEQIEIGRECLIAEFVSIYDSDFHEIDPGRRRASDGPSAPVKIGDRVWLGSRVMVLKGVEIGDDSVIAAGAVVTNSIPPGVIAAGVPAKVIRSIADAA